MSLRRRIKTGASEDRLERLIQERLQSGADKAVVDQKIWDLFGEEWAVMFTDLSGFSRGVAQFGIIHFLQTIYESERLLVPVIEDNEGILLKIEGDSFLVIFRRPEKAIRAGIAMQQALQVYNQAKAAEEAILLCIGLGWGRVLRIGDEDVFGAEVNFASKLGEDLATAGQILVTASLASAATPHGFRFQPHQDLAGLGSAFRLEF